MDLPISAWQLAVISIKIQGLYTMKTTIKARSNLSSVLLEWEGDKLKTEMTIFGALDPKIFTAFDDAVVNAKQYGFSPESTKRNLEKTGLEVEYLVEETPAPGSDPGKHTDQVGGKEQ